MSQSDLVGGGVDCLRGRGTGSIDRICGHARRELRQETDLPRYVRRQNRWHDLAEDDLVQLSPVHLAAIEQLPRRMSRQSDGSGVTKDGAALRERSAYA